MAGGGLEERLAKGVRMGCVARVIERVARGVDAAQKQGLGTLVLPKTAG